MKWISVKDRLPEYETRVGNIELVEVLIADKDGTVWPGEYVNGEFKVFGIRFPHITHITHWMPYPDPPGD